jgi:hypothetical protein
MDINNDWPAIKRLFKRSFSSSFHYTISTVTRNGEPHLTPIGSLILGAPGQGFYFEEFPSRLPENLEKNPQLCVLAVNSSRLYWLKSLVRGRFKQAPAIRLRGRAGATRDATDEEIALWQKRVRSVRFTKGHKLMWRCMRTVRDIEFDGVEPVNIGEMTRA